MQWSRILPRIWKWAEHAHTTIWLIKGLLGSCMVTITAWAAQHWWDALLPAIVFLVCLAVLLLLTFPKRAKARKPLSESGEILLNKAVGEFSSLVWNQKVALRLVYQQPGLAMDGYAQQLRNLGFGEGDRGEDIVGKLAATSLVDCGQGHIEPSRHKAIAVEIQVLLNKSVGRI